MKGIRKYELRTSTNTEQKLFVKTKKENKIANVFKTVCYQQPNTLHRLQQTTSTYNKNELLVSIFFLILKSINVSKVLLLYQY